MAIDATGTSAAAAAEVSDSPTSEMELRTVWTSTFARLRALGASTEDAADMTQETLIVYLCHENEVMHPWSWCATVASRMLIRLRERQARMMPFSDWFDEHLFASPHYVEMGASGTFTRAISDWGVDRVLAGLPLEQRQAFVLSLEGYNHAEIAVALGTSNRAIEGLLYRARRQLQRHLRAAEDDSAVVSRPLRRAAERAYEHEPPKDRSVDPLGDLRAYLQLLRARHASATVRAIAAAAGGVVSYPTVHRALKCDTLPKWRVIEHIAHALEATASDMAALRARYVACTAGTAAA